MEIDALILRLALWLVPLLILLGVLELFKLGAKVNALSRKLDLLMKHSGLNVADAAAAEVRALLSKSPFDKIVAIKVYRDISGASLAEAKAAVERLQHEGRTA